MQGIVFDIKRFAIHDGPGTRTTIFLKGCTLNCWWCHNPESISAEVEEFPVDEKVGSETFTVVKRIGEQLTIDQVWSQIYKEKVFMTESGGGVTISGGEPLLQFKFTKSLLIKCKKMGIHTALDTSGVVKNEKLSEIMPYVDLFLFDFKLNDSIKHKKYCGLGNELIKTNLEYLIKNNKNVIVRIPLIPKVNLDTKETTDMIEYLLTHKGDNFNNVHLLPYHKIGKSKYDRFKMVDKMKNIPELTNDEITLVANMYKEAGFNVVIH